MSVVVDVLFMELLMRERVCKAEEFLIIPMKSIGVSAD
jgi:hypothetical protein